VLSRDSSVSIVNAAAGWAATESWGSIPSRGIYFSVLHSAQIGSGAHTASYPVGTGGKAVGA
jgi:hypothetical protein